jgi:hypothetical protein
MTTLKTFLCVSAGALAFVVTAAAIGTNMRTPATSTDPIEKNGTFVIAIEEDGAITKPRGGCPEGWYAGAVNPNRCHPNGQPETTGRRVGPICSGSGNQRKCFYYYPTYEDSK